MAGRKLHPEILRRLPQSLPHFYFWSPDKSRRRIWVRIFWSAAALLPLLRRRPHPKNNPTEHDFGRS